MEITMPNTRDSSARNINVLVVIDTEYIKKAYGPNQNKTSPVGIDHNSQFMICTGSRGIISGQGSADLNFRANPGDNVAFTGVSIYDNSDDAVILYGISYWQKDQVFGKFVSNVVTRKHAVMPNDDSSNGLPANQTSIAFASYGATVEKGGTEDFYVDIALYTLDDDGETQKLYGYYYWDPSITVN
jgi:hypothetical protein